jgi:hypothetical protein
MIALGVMVALRPALFMAAVQAGFVGICMLGLSVNRILYLHAADSIIASASGQETMMMPVVIAPSLVYISIDGFGDFRLDRWHNSFNDASTNLLNMRNMRAGRVFVDPSDSLPVAVNLDGQIFLLEGAARKRPLLASKVDPQFLAEAEVKARATGIRGWAVVLQLIVFFGAAAAFEYAKVGNNHGAIQSVLFIPAAIVYMLPFLLGSFKRCRGGDLNFVLNLFAGWTFLVWLFVCYRVWSDLQSRKAKTVAEKN